MSKMFNYVTRMGDKTGSVSAVIAALGCSACFPAIASLGAAVGLGFLDQWEWMFINTLMPIAAWLVLVVNALGWFNHRQWLRTVLGMIGPIVLLLSLYPWFKYGWSPYATYSALAMMVAVSFWDIFSPANKHCDDSSCDTPKNEQVQG
jgi:mercuric ion transport protein